MIRLTPRTAAARLMLLFLLLAATGYVRAQQVQQTRAKPLPQNDSAIESGQFRLHKFEQPIGLESYAVMRDGDALVVRSTFEFTDRGTKVPLAATLRTRQDLTPQSFESKGSVSRFATIDTRVEVNGATAAVRQDKETRQAQVPARFFTISGYAPVTMQMMLVRYLLSHHVAGALPVLPSGEITLERRGRD